MNRGIVVCFGSPARWRHGGAHASIESAVDRTVAHHKDNVVLFCRVEES